MSSNARPLIGESVRRPEGARVPMNVTEAARTRLHHLLHEPEMRGVGYSEFLLRACEAAETQIVEARRG